MPPTLRSVRRLALVFGPLLALGALLVLQLREADRVAAHRVGFNLRDTPEGVVVSALTAGLPVARAGLAVGDRLVALDGEPIRTVLDYDRAAEAFERDRRVLFSVARNGQRLELPVVAGVPPPRLEPALNALTVALYLALALVALVQWQEDARARILYVYALAVAVEYAMPGETLNASRLGVATNVAFYLVTGLQMGLDLHLASLIPNRPAWLRRRPWIVVGYYGIGGALGLAAAGALLWLARGRQATAPAP